jgi:hypothetical protein
MSMSDFADARPEKIAQYLFARAGAVTPAYIAQARSALLRLLRYNHDHGVPWDGAFGQLSEVDLFSFLLSVHSGDLGKPSAKQPGLDAVGGVWKGLHYLAQRFRLELPTAAVKTALPKGGGLRWRRDLLQGAVPFPPEALGALFPYICDKSKPRVMRRGLSPLRLLLSVLCDRPTPKTCRFTVSCTCSGAITCCLNTRTRRVGGGCQPCLSPRCKTSSAVRRGLFTGASSCGQRATSWVDVQGDPRSHSEVLLRGPLDAGRIQWAMHSVLREACRMSAAQASIITKHSARKTLLSAAQAAGCPWDH